MTNEKLQYRKEVAFITREKELVFLEGFINERPESILFLHGPKSSGKTTLLYKFLEQIEKEQKLDVKFLNLRKILTEFDDHYNYRDFLNVLFSVEDKKEKTGKFSGEISVGFFKITSEIEKKMKQGRVDPFKIMEQEFIRLVEKGVKPDDYKQKMLGLITYYLVQKERKKRERILSHFIDNNHLWAKDTNEEDEVLLKDMVTNNILNFDPTRAVYYPQGKSYQWGIRLYFDQ